MYITAYYKSLSYFFSHTHTYTTMCMYCRTFHHKLETTDKRTNKQEKKIEIINIKNSKRDQKKEKKRYMFYVFYV